MKIARTLHDALAQAARADAGYWFVAPSNADNAGSHVYRSYADLRERSLRVASALRGAGVRTGDLVALVLPDAEQFLTALFGASFAGATPASLYPPVTVADVPRYVELTGSILRAAAARAVVTTPALATEFESARSSCPDLMFVLSFDALDAPPIHDVPPCSLDAIAFVQFTSGSTSAPKGVALSHRNVAANVDAINGPAGLGTGADDVAVSWLPLNHDMGFVGMALGPLYSTRPGVLLTPQAFVKRPVEWLRAITRYRGTISFAPNFAYDLCVRRVKDRDLDGLDLSSWRIAGCGAEPIHGPTLAAFAEKFAPVGFHSSSFLPCYGLAEHVLAATLPRRGRPTRTNVVSADALTSQRIAVPANGCDRAMTLVACGTALPDHQLRIVDNDGRDVADRHVGEIVLAGPSVMLGYYRQPALTADAIRDGWLHTGDLGYVDGGELFVCGRSKDVIIANGRKYHPQDLEWAVDDLAGARRGRSVAFAVSEAGRPDRVVVVVESSGTSASEALTTAVRRRVGDLFGLYVDEVAIVPSGTVARTTSGKVQRALTRERYQQLVESGFSCD